MDKETMLRWERSAYDAGEVESWLIARVALGCPVGIDESLNLPMRRQRQIVRMTERGAQRLVAQREKRRESWEACSAPDSIDKLKGVIEIDEAFFGGKERNKHESKKLRAGRGPVGKVAVLGMRERGGRTIAKVTDVRTLDAIHGEIHGAVEVGSQIFTDDHMVFQGLDGLFYRHETVNHSAGEYARGPASTNSIESVWAVLKRGLHGVYHHASPKHLDRYVQEFAWRLNEGDVKRHTLDRLASFIHAVVGKRLTYERLTA